MEPENPRLDRYILSLTGKPRPKVCFLGQAGGESPLYLNRFYRAFVDLGAEPRHLSLFEPHTADIAGFLGEQDVIYVGGGNTRSMLALWREWGLDRTLPALSASGIVLAGVSAGMICWFERGSTDSIPGGYTALPCLGLLSGGACPHYDGEPRRRPSLQAMVASGEMPATLALDDSAAAHFINGQRQRIVASRENAFGWWVELNDGRVIETRLEADLLPGA
jgi:peptidase E